MLVHYHFEGSYTASGDGDVNEGNLDNIRLANEHDMGVFIISPYDKGGRLYAPSHLSRELMLPEMEPMQYGEFIRLQAHLVWKKRHVTKHNTLLPFKLMTRDARFFVALVS